MKITFSGGGDDIVTVTTMNPGTYEVEEYYTYERGPVMWHADVTDGAIEVVRVTALQLGDSDGVWHFAAGQIADDFPLPDWPITIRQDPETSYSALLEIDAPDGGKVTTIWPKVGDDDDS